MKSAFDVAVLGAGPGGIAAATVAAEAGLRVCLVDNNRSVGGQIWRGSNADSATKNPHNRKCAEWIARLQRTQCEIWLSWQVIDHPSAKTLRLERESDVRDIEYGRLILATGARERYLPFPGWTMPGVAGAGGLQALVKSGLDVRGKRIVVSGTGPLLLAIAAGLFEAGALILAIYEQAPLPQLLRFGMTLARLPSKITEGLAYKQILRGVPYRTGCWVKRAEGTTRLARVAITNGRSEWTHDCDWLASGYHLVPNLELPMLLECAVENGYVAVDQLQQSSVPGVACVGELTGIGGVDKALVEGEVAGWVAARQDDKARSFSGRLTRSKQFARRLDDAFALRNELRQLATSETIVCRCEDADYAALRDCNSWREAKLHSRCGMGPCQGRICGPQTQFLFGWKYSSSRPPVYPARLSSIASLPDQETHTVDATARDSDS